jgi:hypothetical protein
MERGGIPEEGRKKPKRNHSARLFRSRCKEPGLFAGATAENRLLGEILPRSLQFVPDLGSIETPLEIGKGS